MEPADVNTQAKAGNTTGPVLRSNKQGQPSGRLPPRPKSSQPKRRLATSRGFVNNTRGVHDYITPNSSPFRPNAGSTPTIKQDLDKELNKEYILPGFLNSDHLATRPVNLPIVRQPLTSIRTSVISPKLTVSEASLDWDTYSEAPEFAVSNNPPEPLNYSELQGISGLEEVRKVTLVNTSESSLSMEGLPLNPKQNWGFQPPEMDTQSRIRQLQNMAVCVEDQMTDFTPDDVRLGNLEEVPKRLEEISKGRAEFRNAVRDFKQTVSVQPSDASYLDNSVSALNTAVRNHAHSIWEKVERVKVTSHSNSTASSHVNQARDDTDYKRKLFRDQLLYLTESLDLPDDDEEQIAVYWATKSESDVSNAMHKLNSWQKSLEKLSKAFRDYERAIQQFSSEADPNFISDNEDFESMRIKFKEVMLSVRKEDERRNLQSLLPSKSEKVKYPFFAGDIGEDYFRFKEKMMECYKKNRVPQSDMLEKLRENLKGAALKRVPETIKDIEVAWSNLSEAFGSPMLVLKERLKSLTKLGNVPPDISPSKQIIWYHDFESVVQDIINLGTSDDLNLQMGAFGPPVQEQILRALSDNPLMKREVAKAGVGKQPREKLIAFRDKIVEFRRETQLAEVESGTCGADKERRTSKPASIPSLANVTSSDCIQNLECRVCKQVESQGNVQRFDLYSNHLGRHVFQCPVFMKLNMKERVQITRKSQLCQYCLDSQVVSDRTHENTCKGKKTNTSHLWKCESPGCGRHSWICLTHADNANKAKLKKYADKFSKRGLQFATIGVLSMTAGPAEKSAAFESLERQINRELVPTPDGQPIFLFFSAKGKTRPLSIFFDSGCSRFIMRECIPNKELPASLVKKGRFPIGGVGGCTVFAENEYMVAMDTVDGRAQQLQGVTVKSITSDFPELDITAAVSEVIADAPNNLQLRRCKFPKTVGGRIDCLIGIQYNQLQPVLLHMLPSGLAIYKTKLAPHNSGQRYVLGGSHASFDAILSKVGDTDQVINHFIAGLASWKNLGPPC